MPKASFEVWSPVLLLVALSGCARPMIEGAQITDLPSGFGYDPNCQSYGGLRFGRETIRQRCWFTRGDPPSSAVVTELNGLVDRADLERDRTAEAERRKSWKKFDPVETLTVSRHPAWGWYEDTVYKDQVTGVTYTAVVPWGNRSYVVEFNGRRSEDRSRELARRVVSSFTVIRSGEFHPGKLLAALLLTALGFGAWRWLRRAQAEPAPARPGPLTLGERGNSQGSPPPGPVPKTGKGGTP